MADCFRGAERGTRARTCHLSMSAAATPAAMSHTNSFLTVSGQGEKQPHATKQSALKLTYNLPFKPSGLFLSIGARKQDTSQPAKGICFLVSTLPSGSLGLLHPTLMVVCI